MHKASTGWISAYVGNELNWHCCHWSKAKLRDAPGKKYKEQQQKSCVSDSGFNLPAVKMESNKTHMSPLSGPSWRKDMKSGVMEVFLRHPACCKVYKSGYPSI